MSGHLKEEYKYQPAKPALNQNESNNLPIVSLSLSDMSLPVDDSSQEETIER